jgi:peroxiredoxin|tara:strand:+ start:3770 stop:3979 length:210 start_codon:yes stop_codon:yes gene_type:complete
MLKLLFIIPTLFILMVSLNFFSNGNIVLSAGDKAPSFSLSNQDGKIHNLSDYKGMRVIVYFFPMADTPG